ncbi:S41 family peptidase [Bowmanella pacifica]|uniref:Peptidase S41 n=1 Tax=Bowmanella pacifica TaxID=502051 RepID=A0A918DLK5_9ALTE|nr:S41 family peptidase [Bowmanella pacifica]GGO71710.1 peptidase S41 [Bowmanella pacifica]
MQITTQSMKLGLTLSTLLTLAACGGGGSSGGTSPINNASAAQWQAGVYAASASLKDQCEAPRSGVDPVTNQAYADRKGSETLEKLWLRSWSHESYLWYDELDDVNPAGYSVLEYFERLKTDQRTASGSLKDNFHYAQDTAERNKRTQSGVASGYGFEWVLDSPYAPRRLHVVYIEPGSPADLAGIQRGMQLININGRDVVNDETTAGVDAINQGLFPDSVGQQTSMTFSTSGGDLFEVVVTSADYEIKAVAKTSVLDTAQGRVGYLLFNTFNIFKSQQALKDAVQQLKDANITELVLDLRYNGGGLLAQSSQLGYMITGPDIIPADGFFEKVVFNGKFERDEEIGFFNQLLTEDFYSTGIELPSLDLTRVYVLSSNSTCSASEALINALRGINVEVVLIGDTTCGKPYGFFPTDNCGTTYSTIQFKGENYAGFGEYADGFKPKLRPNLNFMDEVPGCRVDDDLNHALGDTQEAVLAAALQYMQDGSCPLAPPAAKQVKQLSTTRPAIQRSSAIDPLWNNKVYPSNVMPQGMNQ